jgi:hypothetical protein
MLHRASEFDGLLGKAEAKETQKKEVYGCVSPPKWRTKSA